MNGILSVIIDIVSVPAILVALISVLGNVLQKKDLSTIISGGIKTFVGFLIVTAGAGIIEGSLEPFGIMFTEAFNTQGVIPNNEAFVGVALNDYGSVTALIMLLGMIVNVIIARLTKFKYIYLSGHVMLYMAALVAIILTTTGMSSGLIILFGGIALGIANTVFPAMLQPYTKQVTGSDDVALAHTGSFGYLLSAWIGSKVGNKENSTENIKFPKGLSFLRDTIVSVSITMGIAYVIVALFVGNEFVQTNLSGGINYIVFAIQQAGMFAAGVYIILAGVRLILAEIVPAFQGISEKLVPNAIPALDVPIVFPYAQNAVLIGFLSSFAGGIVSMLIQGFGGMTVIIPGVVAHFMCGAASGVYGNATGGRRGAVIGSFVQGIVISFMPLLLMPLMGDLGFQGSTFADTDYGVVGVMLGYLGQFGGQIAVIIGILAALALLFVLSGNKRKKLAKPLHKEGNN